MPESHKDIDKILDEARDSIGSTLSYVTTLRFTVTSNEVFVDLYTLTPNPANLSIQQAERICRYVMPVAVAKDFAEKLLKGVSVWEDAHGVNLPLRSTVEELDEGE